MELAILRYEENQRNVGMFATISQIEVRLTAMLEDANQFEYFGNIDRWNTPVLIEDMRSDRHWYGKITNLSYSQREGYVEITLRMICEDPKMKEYRRLNEKYPHNCHKCGKILFFEELLKANSKITGDVIATLWKREEVEFYCCACYRTVATLKRLGANIEPWFFTQECEQNPHPTVPIMSTPQEAYFWQNIVHARVNGLISPGQPLQQGPAGLEVYRGRTSDIMTDIMNDMDHIREGGDALDAVAHAFGIITDARQADEIIYDKTNKIRRLITKCVKKVMFWKSL